MGQRSADARRQSWPRAASYPSTPHLLIRLQSLNSAPAE
jgi:hypothetical protein